MKIKTMYVAFDGTSFDTEKECIDYEKEMTNKYVVFYSDKNLSSIRNTFDDVFSAKRHIADFLHDCYNDRVVGNFKLVHHGKTVEFNSNELAQFVPAHYKIDGEKLNEVFQMSATKIPGYTLHGDYYLSDEIIPCANWCVAKEIRKEIILPLGKTINARTLSKKELESIPRKERGIDNLWYWTSTPNGNYSSWYVNGNGDFDYYNISYNGGVRLGFKNPFIN